MYNFNSQRYKVLPLLIYYFWSVPFVWFCDRHLSLRVFITYFSFFNWLVDLRNSFSIYYHCIIIVVVIQDIYFSISWLCCCCVSAVFFVYMVILKHHLFLSTAVPKTGHSLLPRLYGFSALSWWLLVYVNVNFVNHLVTLLYLFIY